MPEATIKMSDGVALALHRWEPSTPSIGTVAIVHGLGEHGGRYRRLAGDLASAGWLVIAPDLRGHGRSPGARGTIPADDALRDDVLSILRAARSEATGPLVLLGHSMGGAFAAAAIQHQPDAADALVLSSPALRADVSAFQQLLMRTMRGIAPNVAVGNGLEPQFLSHDRAVVQAYVTDPLVHDRVSTRLAQAILNAGAAAIDAAPRWRTRTLLLYAGADKLVNADGSDAFAAAAPRSFVTTKRFETLFHEIFNETGRDEPVRALLDWLRTLPDNGGV
jgi:alpha-beta hydrolase superfamily lysophospholipase